MESNELFDFIVEWEGEKDESLEKLLEKKQQHVRANSEGLNQHLISTAKKSSISEVIALWVGYNGVPTSLQQNPLFASVLAVTSLALLSPRSLKLIPDSAGEVLTIFELKGFYRTLSKKKLAKFLGDKDIAEEGIKMLLDLKLIGKDDNGYRLLEVPLSNTKVIFSQWI